MFQQALGQGAQHSGFAQFAPGGDSQQFLIRHRIPKKIRQPTGNGVVVQTPGLFDEHPKVGGAKHGLVGPNENLVERDAAIERLGRDADISVEGRLRNGTAERPGHKFPDQATGIALRIPCHQAQSVVRFLELVGVPFLPRVVDLLPGHGRGQKPIGHPGQTAEEGSQTVTGIERSLEFDPFQRETGNRLVVPDRFLIALFAHVVEKRQTQALEINLFVTVQVCDGLDHPPALARGILNVDQVFEFFMREAVGTHLADDHRDRLAGVANRPDRRANSISPGHRRRNRGHAAVLVQRRAQDDGAALEPHKRGHALAIELGSRIKKLPARLPDPDRFGRVRRQRQGVRQGPVGRLEIANEVRGGGFQPAADFVEPADDAVLGQQGPHIGRHAEQVMQGVLVFGPVEPSQRRPALALLRRPGDGVQVFPQRFQECRSFRLARRPRPGGRHFLLLHAVKQTHP